MSVRNLKPLFKLFLERQLGNDKISDLAFDVYYFRDYASTDLIYKENLSFPKSIPVSFYGTASLDK